jgi:excisionase family DNA binding protein
MRKFHWKFSHFTIQGVHRETSKTASVARATLSRLLNDREVAELLGVSTGTIRKLRLRKQGPRYIKIGASVRYTPQSIDRWIESRSTGDGCLQEA